MRKDAVKFNYNYSNPQNQRAKYVRHINSFSPLKNPFSRKRQLKHAEANNCSYLELLRLYSQ